MSAATSAPARASAPPETTTCAAPEVEPPVFCAAAADEPLVDEAPLLSERARDEAAEPVAIDDAADVVEAADEACRVGDVSAESGPRAGGRRDAPDSRGARPGTGRPTSTSCSWTTRGHEASKEGCYRRRAIRAATKSKLRAREGASGSFSRK